jgi:RND family efflux transporter MFP subunit
MSEAQPKLEQLRIERNARRAPPNLTIPVIILAAILIGVVVVIWRTRTPALEVYTTTARESGGTGAERIVLNASGYVTARREATVSSKVTGKVAEVSVEEGLKVTEGQILARLDDTNVKTSLLLSQAQLRSAQASLEETKVRLTEAAQDLQRQTDLLGKDVAARADFDHAQAAASAFKAKLAQQQAEIAVSERSLAVWQQQAEDTIIRAPFAGIVTSKNAQPGEMISPMSAGGFTRTGICTIVDMESLEIEIEVNESYINRVEPGQPVEGTLDAYPDWKIPCRVIAIIPTADRQKSTVKVRVGFDKLDPRILPEMSIKVAFRDTGAPSVVRAVTIPKNSVLNEAGRDIAFVIQNGRAERRAIAIARTQGDETTLSAGVSVGEKIVVNPSVELKDGAAVKEKSYERN